MGGNGSSVKKSPVKRKTTGKSSKTGSTSKSKKKASGPGKSKQKKTEIEKKDKIPFYVLTIMALLTVIVLLINMFYSKDEKNIEKRDIVTKEDLHKDDIIPEPFKGKSADVADLSKRIRKEKKKLAPKQLKENSIKIYFIKYNKNENMSLAPVYRKVKKNIYLRGALNELIKGPNRSEKEKGLLTAIPGNLKLRDFRLQKGCAVLDFNNAIEKHANGSILLSRIDQIVYTVTQFDKIDSIIIKVDGRRKRFLGGEGLSISGPISRRKY